MSVMTHTGYTARMANGDAHHRKSEWENAICMPNMSVRAEKPTTYT